MLIQQFFDSLLEKTDRILVEPFIQRLLFHVDAVLQFQFGDEVVETLCCQIITINCQQAEESEAAEQSASLYEFALPC